MRVEDPGVGGNLKAEEVVLLYSNVVVDSEEGLEVELDVVFEIHPGIFFMIFCVPPVVPSFVSRTSSQPYVMLYDWVTIVSGCVKVN